MNEQPPKRYYVEIRRRGKKWRDRRPVKRMGPMLLDKAEKVRAGIEINLDQVRCRVSIVEIGKRKDYFAAYHRRRYQNDPEFRARKQKKALDYQRKESAAARGDITPWLSKVP